MSDLAAFDLLTVNLRAASPLEVMFDAAADKLHAERGEDAPIGSEEIGACAMELLPQDERDDAQDELFYTFRHAQLTRRRNEEREEREKPIRAEFNAKLAAYREYRRHGDPMPAGLLDDIARLADVLHGGER